MNRLFFYFLFIFSSCFAKPQVYDCFLFNDELELLKIRLHEMYDYVDHFVLVECTETFQGNKKPLHYFENRSLFEEYNDKIIHIIVKKRVPTKNPWIRETYQRNQLRQGLQHASRNDLVIISDLDEILRGGDIENLLAPIISGKTKIASASLRFYRWYLNRLNKSDPFWIGPIAATAEYFKRTTPENARAKRNTYFLVEDIGWHFSNMGGYEAYLNKLNSFSHLEANTKENKVPQKIYEYIQNELELVPIDESFPRLLVENPLKYQKNKFLDYIGNTLYL